MGTILFENTALLDLARGELRPGGCWEAVCVVRDGQVVFSPGSMDPLDL